MICIRYNAEILRGKSSLFLISKRNLSKNAHCRHFDLTWVAFPDPPVRKRDVGGSCDVAARPHHSCRITASRHGQAVRQASARVWLASALLQTVKQACLPKPAERRRRHLCCWETCCATSAWASSCGRSRCPATTSSARSACAAAWSTTASTAPCASAGWASSAAGTPAPRWSTRRCGRLGHPRGRRHRQDGGRGEGPAAAEGVGGAPRQRPARDAALLRAARRLRARVQDAQDGAPQGAQGLRLG